MGKFLQKCGKAGAKTSSKNFLRFQLMQLRQMEFFSSKQGFIYYELNPHFRIIPKFELFSGFKSLRKVPQQFLEEKNFNIEASFTTDVDRYSASIRAYFNQYFGSKIDEEIILSSTTDGKLVPGIMIEFFVFINILIFYR